MSRGMKAMNRVLDDVRCAAPLWSASLDEALTL